MWSPVVARLGPLVVVVAAFAVACTGSPSSPGERASSDTLEVVELDSAVTVEFDAVDPGGRPTLLWFWSPH